MITYRLVDALDGETIAVGERVDIIDALRHRIAADLEGTDEAAAEEVYSAIDDLDEALARLGDTSGWEDYLAIWVERC